MRDFEKRVVTEHDEVAQKLRKLEIFLRESPIMKELEPIDIGLLERQATAMRQYKAALGERIARFAIARGPR